uniref:Uncharacterized protein n=1 Tax=Cacopsylla melanoneura TaxID=428564 RepID=A0A8D8VWH5_9HEMI
MERKKKALFQLSTRHMRRRLNDLTSNDWDIIITRNEEQPHSLQAQEPPSPPPPSPGAEVLIISFGCGTFLFCTFCLSLWLGVFVSNRIPLACSRGETSCKYWILFPVLLELYL